MDRYFPVALGRALRTRRRTAGLTQEQLANGCEIHRTTVSIWERGIYLPSLEYLLIVCDVLDCQPSELLRDTEAELTAIKRSHKPPKRERPGRPRG